MTTRKFTTGIARDVTDSANLLAEMPASMQDWMALKSGKFTHRVEKNGAVIINPDVEDDNLPPHSD